MQRSQIDLETGFREKARYFFGYGDWTAPFWFLGQEEGEPPKASPQWRHRVEAWLDLGKPDICDCQDFHRKARQGDLFLDKPRYVPTWKYLILSLLAYQRKSGVTVTLGDIYTYQRTKWGRSREETCLIELSGVPAKHLKAGAALNAALFTPEEFADMREKRVQTICERIESHKPSFVLMYGSRDKNFWNRIAGHTLVSGEVVISGNTKFVMMPAPAAPGTTNGQWEELGKRLRTCR